MPAFNFSPEQIQQLALLQYLQNPFGSLAGLPNLAAPNPQALNVAQAPAINQSPVIKTSTLFTTKTLPIFFGNKKHYTTVTSEIGVTTVTEYEAGQAAQQKTIAPFQQQQPQKPTLPIGLPAQNPLFNPINLQPSFTVTSEPIVQDTILPSTIFKEIKITFRNIETVTTLTTTSLVNTQITKYVTKTVQATPSINPALGLGNPLAALLG